MPRCVCAVFDYSEDYVKRFSAYIKRKSNLPFSFFAFTKAEAFEEFLKKQKTDLVLLPENLNEADAAGMEKNFKSDIFSVVLGDINNKKEGRRYINKYQSAEGIIAGIMELLEEKGSLESKADFACAKGEITGIYSFGHLDKAVSFALNLAGSGQEQKKALYINLARFSGLTTDTEETQNPGFSDLIYYFKSNSEKIRTAYFAARRSINFTDILTAPDNMEDLDLIDEGDWKSFIGRLQDISGAQSVIIDFGEAFKNLAAAFDLCSRVYLVSDRNKDKRRLDELSAYIKRSGREDLLEILTEAF